MNRAKKTGATSGGGGDGDAGYGMKSRSSIDDMECVQKLSDDPDVSSYPTLVLSVSVSVHVYVSICLHGVCHTFVRAYLCFLCMCVCVHVHVCLSVCARLSVCVSVCVCVCLLSFFCFVSL